MDLNREVLDKFVDGELSPSETVRVAEELGKHPEWNAYVLQQESLRKALQTGILDLSQPVPERLIRAVRETPVSKLWLLRQAVKRGFTAQWLGSIGAALAAGLVIGLVMQPQKEFAVDPSGQLLAQGDLGQILSNRLASENPAGSATRVGISFRNKNGQDCRTFSSGENAGMACRANGNWTVETIVRHKLESPGAEYRMAGSEMPDALRQAVLASIAGEPFDAAAEARARAKGWSGR